MTDAPMTTEASSTTITAADIVGPDDLSQRLDKLEKESKRTTRLAVASCIAAVLLGSGGIFSVIQWSVNGPEISRNLNEAKLAREKHDAELGAIRVTTERYDLEQKKRVEDSTRESGEVQLLTSKIDAQAKVHREAVESITREMAALKSRGDSAAIRSLTNKLIEREQEYRRLLERLRPAAKTMNEHALAGAAEELIRESEVFEARLRSLIGQVPPARTQAPKQAAALPEQRRRPAGSELENRTSDETDVIAPPKSPVFVGRYIRFPPGYDVSIRAEAPEGKYVVLFGYLSVNAQLVSGVSRLTHRDQRVIIELHDGDGASFATSSHGAVDFGIQNARIQNSPLRSLQDDGKMEEVAFRPVTDADGELTGVEWVDLAHKIRVFVSWEVLAEFSLRQ